MELNKIYNMDCVEGMQLLPDNSIDLIVTDPPYLINYRTSWRCDKTHDFCKPIANDNNPDLIKKSIKDMYRLLKDNSAFYMFCSQDTIDFFKKEVQKYFKIKNIIIWVKNHHTSGDLKAQYGKQYEMIIYANKGRKPFNGKRLTDVWFFNRISGNKQLHQNQKPVELIERMIDKSSNTNDTILDPFMGSGTTAIACKNLNRNYIGFEINPDYIKLANSQLTEKPLTAFMGAK